MWGVCVCAWALAALAAAPARAQDVPVSQAAERDHVHKSGWEPGQLVTAARYSLDSALVARGRAGDAGVRVRGELHVTPLRPGGALVLRLEIVDGVVERLTSQSQWRPVEPTGLGGAWGAVAGGGVYLDGADSPPLRDYRRAVASVLLVRGEGPWGACNLTYHHHDTNTLRLALTRCDDDPVHTTRVWRYTRDPAGRLQALVAEETVGGVGEGALPRARGWLRLTRLEGGSGVGGELPEHLQLMELRAETNHDDDETRGMDVAAAWRADVAAAVAGSGGGAQDAAALGGLIDHVRGLSADRLQHMISAATEHGTRCSVLRAAGLAGTAAAAHAARRSLHDPAPALAACYFHGLALAPHPASTAVEWAVETAGGADTEPQLRTAATLAAHAAAARLPRPLPRALAAALARPHCRDHHCTTAWLLAMGMAHSPPSPGALRALLHHAAGTKHAHVALHALAHHAPHTLPKDIANKVVSVALDVPPLPAPRPLDVRAAALVIGVQLTAVHTPLLLAGVVRDVTRDTSPSGDELRRLLRDMLPTLPPPAPVHHDMPHPLLMLNGTSSYMSRAAWSSAAWGGVVTAVSTARGGVLRHQLVTVHARHALDLHVPRELLRVGVLARGLTALAGGGDGDDDVVDCTLQLSVVGVPQPPIVLYSSTAELMSLLWAGAGSEPTPALRVRALARDDRTTARLMLGAVHRRHTTAVAVALDGHGAASLWHRTARGALVLRAALAVNATLRARTPWGSLAAHHHAHAAPALHIHADVDFYQRVQLCVRAHAPSYHAGENAGVVRVRGAGGVQRLVTVPARTLALGDAGRHCHAPDDGE